MFRVFGMKKNYLSEKKNNKDERGGKKKVGVSEGVEQREPGGKKKVRPLFF